MPATSILLVEDSAADIYLMQRAVAEWGTHLRLWVMPDGPEALMFLRKDFPLTHVPTLALIILDLCLPRTHGRQLLPEIRQLPAYQATPIVILSSTPTEHAEQHCLQLGASAYVQKATNFSVYFTALKTLVGHWCFHHAERNQAPAPSPCFL
jgi:two-component system, chemotaxis family, response regulator Rcp1